MPVYMYYRLASILQKAKLPSLDILSINILDIYTTIAWSMCKEVCVCLRFLSRSLALE